MTVIDKLAESRWVLRCAAVIAMGLLLFVAIQTIVVENAVQAQRTTQARADCARSISAEYARLRDEADDALADGLEQVLVGIVDRDRYSPGLVAEALQRRKTASVSLEALGPLDRRVERECPSV